MDPPKTNQKPSCGSYLFQGLKDFKTPLVTSVALAAIALAVVFGILPCCGLAPRTVLLLQVLVGATTMVATIPLITYLSAKARFFRQRRVDLDMVTSLQD